MKVAYLIIAHNEFEVLDKLIECIDDRRNDIYVHFDGKLKVVPDIKTNYSNIYIISNRIDTYWGHISQIMVEYALLRAAHNNKYDKYVLISGVHLPLKTQDEIHAYMESFKGKDILVRVPNYHDQMVMKMMRYNFFTKKFKMGVLYQKLWRFCLGFQEKFHISRNREIVFEKSSQWCILSDRSVECLLAHEGEILKIFRYTFCCDEYFVPTALRRFGKEDSIEYVDDLLECDFIGSSPRVYGLSDLGIFMNSPCLFARKFSSKDMNIVNAICDQINKGKFYD